MTATRLNWQNIRLYIWLVGGLLFLVAAIIFWALTDTKKLVVNENPIEETQTQIQPEKVAATSHLGSLLDEVRPLEMTTRVVASGNHEAEFRGTKFIQDNKTKWTLELFRATKEDVVKAFLAKQFDRKNFIYFRLSGEKQTEQYVLVYGIWGNEAEAKNQPQLLDLNLPKSVRPQAHKFGDYAELVNDLGADELTSGSNTLYEVRLRNAPVPAVDETMLARPKPSTPNTSSTTENTATKTTITRKDSQGNVVDVQRSHSTVDSNKPKENAGSGSTKKGSEQEISDPFN
nr:hypothetical protein [Acinetobacter sp. Marseille-Q1620]